MGIFDFLRVNKKDEDKISKSYNLNDFDPYWLESVNMRVNSMPLNSNSTKLKSIGVDLDGLARMHASEYKDNEHRVPADKRIEVAIDRVEGFFSLKEYLTNNGSKAQKFHLDASLKGALIYATTLGVNIDEYLEGEVNKKVEDKIIKKEINENKFNNDTIIVAIEEWIEDSISAKNKYGPINDWDVSNVTNMCDLFSGAESFNESLNDWDVSNVTNMKEMFRDATAFNQPIGNWDVSNVIDMDCMFQDATAFNQPLNNWDVSNLKYMEDMFYNAIAFNQPLNNWDLRNVIDDNFPDFLNGQLKFREGDFFYERSTNKKFYLNNVEGSVYEYIILGKELFDYGFPLDNMDVRKSNFQKAILWLKENNPDAYRGLLDPPKL
tara:strand:+ start:140 stop:1276 length:1137 start_codon:yes stop_codon:yes gene_type:complete